MTKPVLEKSSTPPQADPPGSLAAARRMARLALAPVERFLAIEASSGILLLVAAAVALAWANSPFASSYEALLHTPIGVNLGPWSFQRDVHFWVNDGVMTIFFFVVGLEIRREIHGGELSELRRAALPMAAALGGMLIPAALYVALNAERASLRGWGIPMATDIAFAVGVLTLLGNRVPAALRVLLLALAVIDDVGAIIVIAIFYSTGIEPLGFAVVALGLLGVLVMQAFGVRSPWLYVLPAAVAWAGAYAAGIHPTLAGVVVGLMTPVRAWYGPAAFVERVRERLAALREDERTDERALVPHLAALKEAQREAVSPVERIQHALHGWVAFGAMPLFALANAGVAMGNASFSGDGFRVFWGVAAGLLIGKPLGIVACSWLAVRLGLAQLPRGLGFAHVTIVGVVGGIGFTMSIFIAALAFPSGATLETAKLGILAGSFVAAVVAYGLGRLVLQGTPVAGAARTEAEAESSTVA